MSGELVILLILVVLIAEGGRVWWRGERKTAGCLWAVALTLVLALTRPWESIGGGQIARKNSCIANLKQMDGAVQQWAEEHKKRPDDPVEIKAMKSYLKGSQLRECPGQGTYFFGRIKDGPKCSLAKEGHTL